MNKKSLFKILCVVLIFVIEIVSVKNVEAKNLSIENSINIEHIDIEDSLKQEEKEYYLYFYKTMCPYCMEVSEVIEKLATKNKVYALNCDIEKNRGQRYDWNKPIHTDKEIGYIDEQGNEIFYLGESAEKYLNSSDFNQFGHKMYYKIYSTIPDGGDLEMLYARMITPEIDYALVNDWQEIIIAGVPTLLHINNGHIDEFYFDSIEIRDMLDIYL